MIAQLSRLARSGPIERAPIRLPAGLEGGEPRARTLVARTPGASVPFRESPVKPISEEVEKRRAGVKNGTMFA